MEEGFADTSDLELKAIWKDKNNAQYSSERIESVRQEMINRGLSLNPEDEIPSPSLSDKRISSKYIFLIVFMAGWTILLLYDFITGQVQDRYGHTIYRAKDSVEFWILLALYLLIDVFGILQLISKLV